MIAAWRLHQYRCSTAMCIQSRPLRSALASLILTAGCVLCDTACVSTKRSAAPTARSVGFPENPRRNPPPVSTTPEPREARAPLSAAASERVKTANDVPTHQVPSSVSTAGQRTPGAVSTPSESSSMVVTTTHRSGGSQVEPGSESRVWPFILGVAIAALAGLALLIRRRPRIGAR
jgi:MYXO-CTERM domain-containing protein